MLTVTRFAAPPAPIITKSSLSFRLIAFCETTKLLFVAPVGEQVRFELRIFVPLRAILIVGVPASEKHVMELIVIAPMRLS